MEKGYLFIVLLLFAQIALAENATENQNNTNYFADNTTQNITGLVDNLSGEAKENITEKHEKENLSLLEVFPKELSIGKAQLNLLVRNTGNNELKNLGAFISGTGILVSNIKPIDELKPREEKYILVWIEARESGAISLTIRILDKIFYEEIIIQGQENEKNKDSTAEISKLVEELADYNKDYEAVERDYENKKRDSYIIEDISLEDAKAYLRKAQAGAAIGDLESTKANIALLKAELEDVKNRLDRAVKETKSLKDNVKENAIWISTILGSIITSFTAYELLKRKKEAVAGMIKKEERETEEKKD